MSVPGKQIIDGFSHCSNCEWSGRIWKDIGFGDMLTYKIEHCLKCELKVGK